MFVCAEPFESPPPLNSQAEWSIGVYVKQKQQYLRTYVQMKETKSVEYLKLLFFLLLLLSFFLWCIINSVGSCCSCNLQEHFLSELLKKPQLEAICYMQCVLAHTYIVPWYMQSNIHYSVCIVAAEAVGVPQSNPQPLLARGYLFLSFSLSLTHTHTQLASSVAIYPSPIPLHVYSAQ